MSSPLLSFRSKLWRLSASARWGDRGKASTPPITDNFLVYAQRPIPLGRRLSFRGGFLLPSGKVPRLAISVALLVAILFVLVLETVVSAKSLFLSNALDLAMILLATICSFCVARRSSGYARQLWTLLTVALSLKSIAQAISAYCQSFVPGGRKFPGFPVFCSLGHSRDVSPFLR